MEISGLHQITISTTLAVLSLSTIEAVFFYQEAQATQIIQHELVTDGGFEITTSQSGNLFPSGFGIWDGDIFSTTGVFGGVTPLEGNQMLRFEALNPNDPGFCCSSDVLQFLDLSQFKDVIETTNSYVSAEAFFNAFERQDLNRNDFTFSLTAHSGELSDFTPSNFLQKNTQTITVDNNLTTWENIDFIFDLPSETSYLSLLISAFETDNNGVKKPPLELPLPGAFADEVSVTLFLKDETQIPEPSNILSSLFLGSYGLFTLLRKRGT
ncbi:MAG: hypothetical protein F6J92_12875 [Symploca sp. SIO1A3]|nr:hypothetical protein [Symploca sp. SIO1A3]